jgi:hypothetical protein
MSKLQMPAKGKSAAMLAELQAAHATGGDDSGAVAPARDNEETNVTTLQETHASSQLPATDGDLQSDSTTIQTPPHAPEPETTERAQRLALAQARGAEDQLTVVTVRVPLCLNRYMDEYVARRNLADPRTRYRKQDAIAQAFAAFYADHPLPPAPDTDAL